MMRKKMIGFISGVALLVSAGCVPNHPGPPLTPETANYGPPPEGDYKKIIEKELDAPFYKNVLFGSNHPVYTFRPPVKAHSEANHIMGVGGSYGWAVCGTLARKQRYAGYATYDEPLPYFVLFINGKPVDKMIGQTTWDHKVKHALNDTIKKVCKGTGVK